jgi:peptidyl-prolyl cis-trans isomerase SurA
MHSFAVRRRSALLIAAALGVGVAGAPDLQLNAQTQPGKTPSATQRAAAQPTATKVEAQAAKSSQAIVVLVNDEPVTAYEIEQRAAFLAISSGGGGMDLTEKAKARWAQIAADPKTNERFQQLIQQKRVKNETEARELQKQYVMDLQRSMMDQLKREARASSLPKFRKEAQEELIEDRLRMQEAKKLGAEITDDDIKRIMTGLAERNKMTEAQFVEHLKSMGVDATTLRERFRAHQAWREVIRRRYSAQIAISQRDVDRIISTAATEAGEDAVELQVQRITLALPGTMSQSALAKRYSEAEALRRKFGGCAGMAGLLKEASDTRFEDLKFIRPSTIAEPTRSMLLNAKDGELLPPTTASTGIEVYAVCGRRGVKADDKQRAKAVDELQQQEFDIMARRHLRDLKQDALIEYR